MKRIPITAAKAIAEQYGYEQVMIYARKVGDTPDCGEWVTTYGTTKAHCSAMAKIAAYIQEKILGWVKK